MSKIRKIFFLVIIMCILTVGTVYANSWRWEEVPGHHNQSILLDTTVLSSKDSVYQYGRGDYLAEGSVEISNNQDGTLGIVAMTLAHRNVDMIMHSIYIDVWDAEENDWMQLDYWHYSQTKEETEDGELYILTTSLLKIMYPLS